MAHVFIMPQLGSTMEEGTILKWHKQVGERVRQGDTLVEIETDKATMEVESTATGVLRTILARPDEIVAIRTPIAIIGEPAEPIDHLLGAQVAGSDAVNGRESVPTSDLLSRDLPPAPDAPPPPAQGRMTISPRARRRADEQGVPLTALAGLGTGPEGSLVERDVTAYLERLAVSGGKTLSENDGRAAPRMTPLAARIADDLGVNLNELAEGLPGSRVRSADVLRHVRTPAPQPPVAQGVGIAAGSATYKLTGMRKRIADNVSGSAFSAPHVTLTLEVDMSACAEFRRSVLPELEVRYGARLSYTDILVKAAAIALGKHPRLNAVIDGDEITLFAEVNIGVAVALEEGLIVPVIKSADAKSLGAVSAELKQLVERARTGRFTPDDLAGGTFTITNLGGFGIDVFDPIIVAGQAAILGVGRIADKPAVVAGQLVVRTLMNLCLSFDHRILDGAPAARFLQQMKDLLENPMHILL